MENARLELATGIPRIAVHGVPHRKPAERFRRGEDEQRNEQGTAFQAVPRDMELVRTTQEPYTGGLFHRIVRRIAIRLQVAGVVLQHLPGYKYRAGCSRLHCSLYQGLYGYSGW